MSNIMSLVSVNGLAGRVGGFGGLTAEEKKQTCPAPVPLHPRLLPLLSPPVVGVKAVIPGDTRVAVTFEPLKGLILNASRYWTPAQSPVAFSALVISNFNNPLPRSVIVKVT